MNMDKSEKEHSKRKISHVLVSWSHLSVFFYDSTPSRLRSARDIYMFRALRQTSWEIPAHP